MQTRFTGFIRALASKLRLSGRDEERKQTVDARHSKDPDSAELEDAITAFRELISKLSQNGAQIGELYLSAERKAARYAVLSETVVESVTSGILVVDDMHEICLANSAAKRILGCDQRIDLTGKGLGALFEEHRQLQTLVSEGFRSCRNSSRKVIGVSLHGGAALCLGVSTSCVTLGKSKPEAVIIVFTRLDKDATGMVSGQTGDVGASAEAYRKGMLDAYGIVSEIYTDIEGLCAEVEKGEPDVAVLAGAAERVEFACDLMVGFALARVGPDAMTELVDVNSAVRALLETAGLSGRRVMVRLGHNLPRVSTVRRVLDSGLDMLLKGSLAESADGVEITTRLEESEDRPAVTLSIRELSPTLPIVEVANQPRGFLEGKGLRRETGLMLLKSLPAKGHTVAMSRKEETLTYSLSFLMPNINKEEKESAGGGFEDSESSDGETRF